MALARGGSGNSAAASATQQYGQRVAYTLFPHAERGTLVLIGGLALLVAWTVSNEATRNPMVAVFAAIFRPSAVDNKTPFGAAGDALKAQYKGVLFVIVLAVAAGISDEVGTLVVLFLAALWVAWALHTFGTRGQQSAPKPQ